MSISANTWPSLSVSIQSTIIPSRRWDSSENNIFKLEKISVAGPNIFPNSTTGLNVYKNVIEHEWWKEQTFVRNIRASGDLTRDEGSILTAPIKMTICHVALSHFRLTRCCYLICLKFNSSHCREVSLAQHTGTDTVCFLKLKLSKIHISSRFFDRSRLVSAQTETLKLAKKMW